MLAAPSSTLFFAPGHYWLGRVVDAGKNHHLGKGVLKQVTAARVTISDTMFTQGDIAIAIEWYDRTTDDDEGLSFEKWLDTEGDASVQTISSGGNAARIDGPGLCALRAFFLSIS